MAKLKSYHLSWTGNINYLLENICNSRQHTCFLISITNLVKEKRNLKYWNLKFIDAKHFSCNYLIFKQCSHSLIKNLASYNYQKSDLLSSCYL